MAKIHIADDNADIRHLLSTTFTESGHEVSASENGNELVESVLKEPPDVLVMDVMMPELDGFDVLQAIHGDDRLADMKILVLTVRGNERDRRRGFALGAHEYMTKPFRQREVVDAVDRLLASPREALQEKGEQERERAYLLSQLETILDASVSDGPAVGEAPSGDRVAGGESAE